MLETLSIVAYRQPICRADVEKIRGVQVGEILQHLLEKGLIRLAGRDASLGRPFLYGTTRKFLQAFGLRNLNELPLSELLTRPAEAASPASTEPEPATTG
jgi:segregation and condensation protein B